MTDRFYSRMFVVAATWNLVGGVVILLATDRIFAGAGLPPPEPAYYQSWIALFMTFGIGYCMVSRDPHGRRDIVLLGIIGKLAFAFVFLYHMAVSTALIPTFFLIPVIGDLVFVVLFAIFLRWSRRGEPAFLRAGGRGP